MCLNPLTIRNPRRDFNQYIDPLYLQVPCGHCLQCQRSKLIDLETRAVCEYEKTIREGGLVYNYTLTYDEDHVPWYCGIRVLCRRDFQLFKKRLKKLLGDVGDALHIAYFGEIGKKNTKRSHFHVLIYSDIRFDPFTMALMIKHCWKQGMIGYPNKMLNGVPLEPSPSHAVVDGVNAIRYCIKYCAKSYDITSYLYQSFYSWLYQHGITDKNDIEDFAFPDDERFKFPVKNKMDIHSIVKYFSSCYRVPNNFGECQLDNLNEYYDYWSKIPYKGSVRVYHISKFCKSKIFTINCLLPNNVKISHKTKRWIDYNRKLLPIFASRFQNNFLANKKLPLFNIDLPYDTVESALKSLYDNCCCSLSDYFIFRTLFTTSVLEELNLESVLAIRQSRDVSYIDLSSYNPLLAVLPHWLTWFCDTLKLLYQEIYYQKYLKQYQTDINYQNVKSFIYNTVPQYPSKLSFHQIINPMIRPKPQPIESEQVPPTYGLVPSASGDGYERAVVPDPTFPPVSTFDIDTLQQVGLSPSIAPSILTPSIEEFQTTLDNIDFNSKSST